MSSSRQRVTTKRGKAFSTQEDENLCIAWLTISQDPVIGTAQRDSTFWSRVSQHFTQKTGGKEARTECSIQNRWEKIRLYCTKYRGCLAQIQHMPQSGSNTADSVERAKEMYESDIGKPFIFEHCWEMLKDSDKWVIVGAPSNRSPTFPVEQATPVTPISLDSDQDPYSHGSVSSPMKSKRPMGQKAGKEARRKSKESPADSHSLSDKMKEISSRRELRKNLFDEQKLQMMKKASDRAALFEEQKLQMMRASEVRLKAAEDREQQAQDDAIMSLDIRNMPPDQRYYYQLRKDAIMAKAMKFSNSSNFSLD